MDGVINMLKIQWKCLFVEITNPGIPWTGMQCRSLRAGGTGILYALPAFVSPSPDKYLWIIQGIIFLHHLLLFFFFFYIYIFLNPPLFVFDVSSLYN